MVVYIIQKRLNIFLCVYQAEREPRGRGGMYGDLATVSDMPHQAPPTCNFWLRPWFYHATFPQPLHASLVPVNYDWFEKTSVQDRCASCWPTATISGKEVKCVQEIIHAVVSWLTTYTIHVNVNENYTVTQTSNRRNTAAVERKRIQYKNTTTTKSMT